MRHLWMTSGTIDDKRRMRVILWFPLFSFVVKIQNNSMPSVLNLLTYENRTTEYCDIASEL